jgi:hypothetical protein
MRRAAPLGAFALLLLSALGVGAAPAGRPSAADPALGRRIYRDGILPSGRPLVAELPSGIRLQGAAAACASCHRRSGFGGAEGTLLIPPVTGPALFAGAGRDRASLFIPLFHEELAPAVLAHLHGLGERPPYTAASLAVALAAGQDTAGRPLDPLMPRYPLSAAEVGHLTAYLRTLAAAPEPGVEKRTLHLATVITPGADPDRAARVEIVREVQEAYLRWHNAEVERRLARPVPPASEEEALGGGWRRWQLQVWELRGPQGTWAGQLARFQRARPVFALVGGLDGGAGWGPVHAFCEAEEIPCLFPATDRPPADDGATALYLSGGLPAEATALSEALWARAAEGAGGTVVQVYRDDARGRDVARRLRTALAGTLVEPAVDPAQADRRTLALVDRSPPAALRTGRPCSPAGRRRSSSGWAPATSPASPASLASDGCRRRTRRRPTSISPRPSSPASCRRLKAPPSRSPPAGPGAPRCSGASRDRAWPSPRPSGSAPGCGRAA